MSMLGKGPIITERGTFQTLTLLEAANLLDADETEDVALHDTASDALDWIDVHAALAILGAGGLEAAAALFREDQKVTTVSEFLTGIPDVEGLLVHLAKCAVVYAVKQRSDASLT